MKWVKEISDSDQSLASERSEELKRSIKPDKNLTRDQRARNSRADNINKCFIHPKRIKGFNPNNKEHLWAEYNDFEFYSDEKTYKRFQQDYETFCGGFLYYHDEHVKAGKADHFIYFKWGQLKNDKGSVSIYLWPEPTRVKKSKKVGSDEPMKEQYSGGTPAMAKNAALPPLPDEEESVDPPKPPPPPPPSML